jgi:hypothetical protein
VERPNPIFQHCWDEGSADGRAKAYREGIEAILDLRFGADGLALMPRIRQLAEPAVLEQLFHASKSTPDHEAFRDMLPTPPQA